MPVAKQIAKRLLKSVAYRPMETVLGFRRLRHLARWFCMLANADGGYMDFVENGEAALARRVLAFSALQSVGTVVVIDVGANDGEYSELCMQFAQSLGLKAIAIHAFEPSPQQYRSLCTRLQPYIDAAIVKPQQFAVGAVTGTAVLHIADRQSHVNSLLDVRHDFEVPGGLRSEEVRVTSLDDHANLVGIDRVALLKIDTEGNDFDVLRGAVGLLGRKAVDVIQFEYNYMWIDSRSYLRDAFDLLFNHGYQVGKLRRDAVERFERWDYRLEWFEQSNYVAWPAERQPPYSIIATDQYLTTRV